MREKTVSFLVKRISADEGSSGSFVETLNGGMGRLLPPSMDSGKAGGFVTVMSVETSSILMDLTAILYSLSSLTSNAMSVK